MISDAHRLKYTETGCNRRWDVPRVNTTGTRNGIEYRENWRSLKADYSSLEHWQRKGKSAGRRLQLQNFKTGNVSDVKYFPQMKNEKKGPAVLGKNKCDEVAVVFSIKLRVKTGTNWQKKRKRKKWNEMTWQSSTLIWSGRYQHIY